MKESILLLGFVIDFVGIFLTSENLVVGAIVLLIGIVTSAIGVVMPSMSDEIARSRKALHETEGEEGQVTLASFTRKVKSKERTCGSCLFFDDPKCPYRTASFKEDVRASYCVSYRSQQTGK